MIATRATASPTMRPVLLLCFFLSGASGLVFELLWTRMLTLVFGSTTLAISTVLATFMGGLGLGSHLAGRLADRVREPVRAYALCELGIGVYALAVPWAIGWYGPLNQWLWSVLGDRYTLLSLARFVAAAALLLPPTTAMGATLPVLARHFVTRPADLARAGGSLGRLYAANLLGACAGAGLAGFLFLPALGVTATNRLAAGFNFTLATAAWLAWRRLRRGRAVPEADLDALLAEAAARGDAEALRALPPPPRVTPRERRVVLVAFALSGATAMTLQGLWTRALAVVVGSSVYSFTIILLAFLIGLGGGAALLGARADRSPHPARWLALTHLGITLAVALSYLLLDDLPFVFTFLVSGTHFGVSALLICQFALVCLAVLPATLLMGAVFPLTMRAVTGAVDSVGRDVGRSYAINTLGAIAGSFASGFVVLPGLGLQRGIALCAGAGAALAAWLLAVDPSLPRARRRLGLGAAAALAALCLALPRWDLTRFSIGFFRASLAKDYVERRAQGKTWKSPELVFYEDGIATTVSVDRWGETYSMKNNGKVDASSDADMPTQVAVGLLPLLLYPGDAPPRAALIGFGSGVTAGAMTQGPLASLEVIELEPAIYRAARFFDHVSHRPLENPKVTARVGDGRNFLSQRDDRFDVIVSQPSNPWITGVSNLFTREYFQAVRRRLAPGGLFCQWAQLYEMAPWNVKTIYRTLAAEFPHVLVFSAEDLSSDTILIASLEPLAIDLPRLRARLADPVTAAEARRAGWEEAHDIPARLLIGPDELDAFTAGAVLNTDDNARIEFAAPRDLLGAARHDRYLARVYGPHWPYGHLLGLVTGIDAAGTPGSDAGRLARALLLQGRVREAMSWVRRAQLEGHGDAVAHARLLLRLVATRLDDDPEIPLAPGEELAPPRWPDGLDAATRARLHAEHIQISSLVRARRYVGAFKLIERWPDAVWDDPPPDFALLAGFLHYKAEYFADAIGLLKPLLKDPAYLARRPETLYYLGRARYAEGLHRAGIEALEDYLRGQRALDRAVLPEHPGIELGADAPAAAP